MAPQPQLTPTLAALRDHLLRMDRPDGAALAAALASLIGDSARRDRLAREGAIRAREIATPERIGAELAAALGGQGR